MDSSVAEPRLTPVEQAALSEFWLVYDQHFEQVAKEVHEDLLEHPELAAFVAVDNGRDGTGGHALVRQAIVDGDWEPYLRTMRAAGERYADAGVSFSAWFEAGRALRVRVIPRIVSSFADQPQRLANGIRGTAIFIDLAMVALGEAYLARKQAIIRSQQQAIKELSTPVLELTRGVLLLPMIGLIDSERARLMTEQLLMSIAATRAKVAILDITGVPAVDSAVANHLVQSVKAVSLMGATSLISGISSQNAQTLVRLGVDVGGLRTVGALADAVEVAFELSKSLGQRNGNGSAAAHLEVAETS